MIILVVVIMMAIIFTIAITREPLRLLESEKWNHCIKVYNFSYNLYRSTKTIVQNVRQITWCYKS